MGRTQPTFNMYLDHEIAEWSLYRRALRREDQPTFDRLFAFARRHMAEAGAAARSVPFDALLMSILLEQQKAIEGLERRLMGRPHAAAPGALPASSATAPVIALEFAEARARADREPQPADVAAVPGAPQERNP